MGPATIIGLAIGALGLVISAMALAFQRGWLPPKYHMADSHPLEDPVTAKIFGPASVFDHSPRKARVVPRYLVPKYRADGFKPVRVAFGREFRFGRQVVWTGKVSDGSIQECPLMARPPNAAAAEASPASGQKAQVVHSMHELPEGVSADKVAWVRRDGLAGRRKVIDNAGREWHLERHGGPLFLVWKE